MSITKKTKKIIRLDDPVTAIGYKIIHCLPADKYEIWTYYHSEARAIPLRNKICTDEALRFQHDVDRLISYVENTLIKQHYNFYSNDVFEQISGVSTDENNRQVGNQAIDKPRNDKTIFKLSDPMIVKNSKSRVATDGCVASTEPILKTGTKTQQIEALFLKWEQAQREEPDAIWNITKGDSQNITKEHFRRDGIIDEKTFENEKRKVLFISAEANDDQYSAKNNKKPNSIDDYIEYNRTGYESWGGRMRERLAEMYKVICRIERESMSNPEAVLHFSVMDINKRGGGSDMKKGTQVREYCRYYADFIRAEIDIISPDVVAIVGRKLYDLDLHVDYLDAINEGGKCYFLIKGKKVPILSLYQTCFFQGRGEPLSGYGGNLTVGRQAKRCLNEMKRFGI